MIYRTIITPKETNLTIELPKELIGKAVEVLAFEIENRQDSKSNDDKFAKAIAYWDSKAVDMSHFKFNREEANER